jgi:hypothetical protein
MNQVSPTSGFGAAGLLAWASPHSRGGTVCAAHAPPRGGRLVGVRGGGGSKSGSGGSPQ